MTVAADIQRMADALWAMAQAPRDTWLGHAHRIEAINVVRVGTAEPRVAMLLASAAKGVARQMPHTQPELEDDLRGVAMALSNSLVVELRAAGVAIDAEPYHMRGQG